MARLICGDPGALASALAKISSASKRTVNMAAERAPAMAHMYISNPLSGARMDNLFSTHPNAANRIAALTEMARMSGGGGGQTVPAPAGISGRTARRAAFGRSPSWRTPGTRPRERAKGDDAVPGDGADDLDHHRMIYRGPQAPLDGRLRLVQAVMDGNPFVPIDARHAARGPRPGAGQQDGATVTLRRHGQIDHALSQMLEKGHAQARGDFGTVLQDCRRAAALYR